MPYVLCVSLTFDMTKRITLIPHRGLLKDLQTGAGFSGRPVSYIATHDTKPPEGQTVTTDQSSLLIRCLQSKKRANDLPSSSEGPGRNGKRKSSAEEHPVENKRRGNDVATGSRSAVQTVYSIEALSQMTVKELQDILATKNESIRGKKTELIDRIMDRQ